MKSQIVKHAEDYVSELLQSGLTEDHVYHDIHHTFSVREASLFLGKRYQLTEEEMEVLELAALFHDTGFTRTYDGHEDASKQIAEEFLKEQQYPEEKIAQVSALIEVTKVGVEPRSLPEKIIKDADFNTNGISYLDKAATLRHEWKVFKELDMDEDGWLNNNLLFWSGHQFYTGEAKALYGDEKRKTLKKLKKKTQKSDKKNKAPAKVRDELEFAINSSKSAQMMFKTTLRNQIDLTNIADNKANIMLSINSLLITFGIPLLATKIEESPELIYPATVLLLTCILSIVYATLATRPVKMKGYTDLEMVDQGNTNLFFFGNFFKMAPQEYREGLKKVVQNDQLLDKTIVNDLYFLGTTLGKKYRRLHTTYSIFMIGMVLTVLTYALTFMIIK